jgi:hypothetical protein
MIKTLIKEIERLDLVQRIRIFKYLLKENIKHKECNDGSRVNLDILTTEQIEGLIGFVDMVKSLNVLPNKYVLE